MAIVTPDARPPTGNGPPQRSSAGPAWLRAASAQRHCVGGLAACSGDSGHSQAGGTTTTSTTRRRPAALRSGACWRGCSAEPWSSPATPTYANDALLFNELLTSPQPAAIAYCANAADVQRCVAYARAHDVPLAARSGGHSYGGYSSSPGLVIDVSSLNTVSVAPGMQLATVGAGAQLIDIYSQLGSSGLPPSRRVVPDCGHRRLGARRRDRRLRSGLRPDVRQHRVAGDRHRRWISAPLYPPQQQPTCTGPAGAGVEATSGSSPPSPSPSIPSRA